MRRVSDALTQLSKRVGFRIIPGLGERVIYRELFPTGLTMIDAKEFGAMGLGHVASRQELREMMAALQLPEPAQPSDSQPSESQAAEPTPDIAA
ncbi:hypothetical protein WR25_04874 [Diploscapter pachys]|uniref:Uncharacterized protein n=2 Tax=cellular organisms TaxID=131567 RepID=A0A2A2M533_9BILA|nr:hypothetical protein WR25_04874 [Diploscapter pachys]